MSALAPNAGANDPPGQRMPPLKLCSAASASSENRFNI